MLAAMFPGLSIPNEKQKAYSSDEEKENKQEEIHDSTVDDMMAVLESMAPSKQQYENFKQLSDAHLHFDFSVFIIWFFFVS